MSHRIPPPSYKSCGLNVNSMGRFRRYRCSTLFNYDSNLFMCGTFLQKSIHLPDNRRLLATPEQTYDLNLSSVTLSIRSFRTQTSIFSTTEMWNPVFSWLSLHSLLGPPCALVSNVVVPDFKLQVSYVWKRPNFVTWVKVDPHTTKHYVSWIS